MRTKLIPAAGALVLLLIPTITPALAESLGSANPQNVEAIGTLSGPDTPLYGTPTTPNQMSNTGTLPSRGMTMAQVEQAYGTPVIRKAPVGNPPITRWEYEGFIVYFEHRHVIHSVTRINR